MFAKLAEYLTQQLENENVISSDKRELYRYGFQNGMILTLNFITSILIGVIFGKALESIILLAAYIPLRCRRSSFKFIRKMLHSIIADYDNLDVSVKIPNSFDKLLCDNARYWKLCLLCFFSSCRRK